MSLKFLTSSQGAQEYLETDYFKQMNQLELIYRLDSLGADYQKDDNCQTLRKKLINTYTTLTLDFTDKEKNVVDFYFRQLFNLLWKKAPGLIPTKKPIGLIKLSPNVDWDYPYTIGHSIIIPSVFLSSLIAVYQQHVDQLGRTSEEVWNLTRPNYDAINQKNLTLCHELIHILQRNTQLYPGHQTIFDFIYEQIWGFKKIRKSQIKFPHISEEQFFNVLTNPDGYNFQWLMPVYNHDTNSNHLFLPLLSRNLANKPVGILVEVTENRNPQKEIYYLITKHWNFIYDIKRYSEKFYGLDKQLYHPHEISSHLISNYVMLDHIYSDTQDTFDYYKFYRFINKYLVSMNFTPFRDR